MTNAPVEAIIVIIITKGTSKIIFKSNFQFSFFYVIKTVLCVHMHSVRKLICLGKSTYITLYCIIHFLCFVCGMWVPKKDILDYFQLLNLRFFYIKVFKFREDKISHHILMCGKKEYENEKFKVKKVIYFSWFRRIFQTIIYEVNLV